MRFNLNDCLPLLFPLKVLIILSDSWFLTLKFVGIDLRRNWFSWPVLRNLLTSKLNSLVVLSPGLVKYIVYKVS